MKEQASGLYAQTMAERGFLTIAFDPSFTGESGGEPRCMASPDINTEDFQAAVDFLSVQDNVDPNKIGIISPSSAMPKKFAVPSCLSFLMLCIPICMTTAAKTQSPLTNWSSFLRII